MSTFLTASAAFVMAMVALGLLRLLRGPGRADRVMAMQLLGTGGIAALLLGAVASGIRAGVDLALVLALLAAFAAVAFVDGARRAGRPDA